MWRPARWSSHTRSAAPRLVHVVRIVMTVSRAGRDLHHVSGGRARHRVERAERSPHEHLAPSRARAAMPTRCFIPPESSPRSSSRPRPCDAAGCTRSPRVARGGFGREIPCRTASRTLSYAGPGSSEWFGTPPRGRGGPSTSRREITPPRQCPTGPRFRASTAAARVAIGRDDLALLDLPAPVSPAQYTWSPYRSPRDRSSER